MAIYTCFEMIDDCRHGRPAGWAHLVTHFVPAFARLLDHYRPDAVSGDFWNRFLGRLRDDERSPLATCGAVSEREFVFEIRDYLLAFAGLPPPEGEVDWEAFQAALEPFTAIERQTVWLETLGYDNAASAALMRVSAETGTETRQRAAAALAERMPGFSVSGQGPALRARVVSMPLENAVPLRQFLRAIDGQLNWSDRKDLEAGVVASWPEVDRFCRIREADAAVRGAAPLDPERSAPILRALGVAAPKKPLWQRVFAGS